MNKRATSSPRLLTLVLSKMTLRWSRTVWVEMPSSLATSLVPRPRQSASTMSVSREVNPRDESRSGTRSLGDASSSVTATRSWPPSITAACTRTQRPLVPRSRVLTRTRRTRCPRLCRGDQERGRQVTVDVDAQVGEEVSCAVGHRHEMPAPAVLLLAACAGGDISGSDRSAPSPSPVATGGPAEGKMALARCSPQPV